MHKIPQTNFVSIEKVASNLEKLKYKSEAGNSSPILYYEDKECNLIIDNACCIFTESSGGNRLIRIEPTQQQLQSLYDICHRLSQLIGKELRMIKYPRDKFTGDEDLGRPRLSCHPPKIIIHNDEEIQDYSGTVIATVCLNKQFRIINHNSPGDNYWEIFPLINTMKIIQDC